ncbi:MAG TPA: TIGR04500 family putative peptide maturation system protein [Blastocatellia bacterium]|nr:TIGR04500 family putative peptide maturation system protein [Blastocatellia bacterium]
MSATLQQTVSDTLDYLMTLIREGVRPQEAKARLSLLQKRHPHTGMNLLWEEEAYDGSVHYDALLRLSEGATVSLSFCPERAMPWPLRGAHRWSETELARVNDTVLRVEQAIACLDFIWNEAPIINRLINVCLIQEEFERDPVELTDAELQFGMDGFRRAHKLYSAEDTYFWMRQRGMTHERLERLVADNLAVARLRDRIAEGRVEIYFEDHCADFDTVHIARIEFSDEESARRLHRRILTGEVDFYEAAQSHFLAAAGGAKMTERSLFASIRRHEASGELGAAVFAADQGEVVGPARVEDGYAIAHVLSSTPARLDDATRAAIKEILFEEWLSERRQAARIEWHWGNSERAPQTA